MKNGSDCIMKYCIVDIECTCWDYKDPNKQAHEIIEVGAVILDENYNYIKEFTRFVKPFSNPTLTEYCKDLTSITQRDIDTAVPLCIAISWLKEWMGPPEDITFCSWGYFDKEQLLDECRLNVIDFPFNDNHINIKVRFSTIMERTKKIGLRKALRILNIQFEGTQHRAIFDALMTSKVFKVVMDKDKDKAQ